MPVEGEHEIYSLRYFQQLATFPEKMPTLIIAFYVKLVLRNTGVSPRAQFFFLALLVTRQAFRGLDILYRRKHPSSENIKSLSQRKGFIARFFTILYSKYREGE